MLKNSFSADRPLVSAVIPTRGRPDLLACAIRSALRQTWRDLEVIVVIDGPDEETERRVASIADSRLRTVTLPEISGGCSARNAGVRAARGEWIAFLDDDDEWLPEKIERQMCAVGLMKAWFPVVTCRLIQQAPTASRVLPPRVYESSQPVADYLFCRSGLSDPGGLMQTSTLLTSRDLLLAIPFRDGLLMHQDWDWIIRVAAHEGVVVTMLAKPLSIWRVEDGRATVGRNPGWQTSLAWIRGIRRLISRRSFSSFVAVQCVWRAKRVTQAHWRASAFCARFSSRDAPNGVRLCTSPPSVSFPLACGRPSAIDSGSGGIPLSALRGSQSPTAAARRAPLSAAHLVDPETSLPRAHSTVTDYTRGYLAEVRCLAAMIDQETIDRMIGLIVETREKGGRIFFLGVGGSAGNAGHAVNDFRKIAGIECYAPTDNVAELTARINDAGWDTCYAEWLRGSRLNKRDTVFVLSVGGGNLEHRVSMNLVACLNLAREAGARILGVVGRDGGYTAQIADACLVIPTISIETVTPHAEEFQAVIWHLIVSHPLLRSHEMRWESTQ